MENSVMLNAVCNEPVSLKVLEEPFYRKGFSPFVNKQTGTWWEYDDDKKGFFDTGVIAQGRDGNDYVITEKDYDTIVERTLSNVNPTLDEKLSSKLPKSPTEWGIWTPDEQAAARERMSAEKALSGNVVFDETITESVAAMKIPVPRGWNNILLRVLYPKAGAEYAGGVNTGDIFATAGVTSSPYNLYVYGNSISTPTYPDRRLFVDLNLIKRGTYAELNRYIAGATGEAVELKYSVLSSNCAYSDVEVMRFSCDHIPAGTQFILCVD